jgi:hypothetical protein
MATTGICDSFKAEVMESAHCLNAVLSQTGTTHSNQVLDVMATTAGIAVGMAVSGTNIAASSVVESITSATAVTVSRTETGSAANTMTFTGDACKLALVKVSPTRTFDHTQTNIGTPGSGSPTATNLGTDEISASGTYSSGGMALTNTTPVVVSGVGVGTFSNVSITSATISTTAAIIYNNSTRLGAGATPLNGRTISVHDFGGTQTVTSGTLTLTMPTADQTNGLLRIS